MSARSAAQRSPAVAARDLIAELTATPTGQSSVSVYETGRLVSLSPWLTLHVERIRYLLDVEHAGGGWGGPGGYGLVPTLSATEGLLAALRRADLAGTSDPLGRGAVAAVDRGLTALAERLTTVPVASLPDMPAVDLIVPALVEALTAHLHALRDEPVSGLERWREAPRLSLPPGMETTRLARVRAALAAGHPLPKKLLHALEVTGPAAYRAPGVVPVGPGTVGASPAATAAWLGVPDATTGTALAYLEGVVRQHGGPVPCTSPISIFERSWVLSTLARARVPLAVPAPLLASLRDTIGPTGTATAPGLPVDADTTSVTLYALARAGHPVDPSSLEFFDTGEHFCTWPKEDGASITTNAHVLDAFGWHLRNSGAAARRLDPVVRRLTVWLADRQAPEGSWSSDRWHASPYYATSCAVLALHGYGVGPAVEPAVRRAVRWVMAGQHADGSWGRWGGTAEETAYALQVLLAAGPTSADECGQAVARGWQWLITMDGADDAPALWHDKDLYRPSLIVRAAVLAATWWGRSSAGPEPVEVESARRSAMIRIA
ncbi:Squalene-hopene cyclase C-terminal domain-containing protein [Micromonospora pallida]|uniref:Squalene-hopene cyclase C-terminal domain-containing protein n=1 Tax=Micromonospora pallida TaxID=145854 RepID=A0A1C6RQG4_9ACTN|nr:prenyltransferase/squalene oxidase repeat-containing protein [Micromonospora pallida]SCL19307.1 Squalene-hopene cyclase C-terminal domain-containing protein [Micromonospora pallida]